MEVELIILAIAFIAQLGFIMWSTGGWYGDWLHCFREEYDNE